MKKSWMVLIAAMLLVLLCQTAYAAWPTPVKVDFVFYVGEGETVLPDYPDLAHLVGDGLTMDDFDVRITTSLYTSDVLGFNADGSYTAREGGAIPRTTSFYMFYIPKKGVNAKETVFQGTISIHKPLTSITLSDNDVTMAIDETVRLGVGKSADSAPAVSMEEYDASIVHAEFSGDTLTITPVAVGETDIVIRAYNGVTGVVHVKVTEPPTKFEFLTEDFVCYTGDRIPIEADFGDGSMYGQPTIGIIGNYATQSKMFPNGWQEFYAYQPGEYKVTMTTHNGHQDSFNAVVYSRENCVQMTIRPETVTVGNAYVYIYCYDRNGNYITPQLEIIQGSDIARVEEGMLVTTGAGTVTIRAINPDGTTVEKTVEVYESPTQIILNATEVTLEIGETFELEVGFDKGQADYTLYWQSFGPDEYGLYPVQVSGQTVTAITPGQTNIDVRAGGLSAECTITVVENDKRLLIQRPEGELAVGQTYQLQVVDKAGRVYPAKFRAQYESYSCPVTVTEDGLMKGQTTGECFVYADLENGLTMRFKQQVVQVPAWITHANVTLKLNDASPNLGMPTSDVGLVEEYTTTIADESVAQISGGLKLLKEGTTEVTMTAVRGGAQCTFTLTVEPADDTLYIMVDGERYTSYYYSIDIPDGYSKKLPDVTDYYGNKVAVTWKITSESVAYGNPNKTAFRLSNGSLKATWVDGNCQLTATAQDGRTIVMNADAYRLPDKIKFRYDSYTVNVGEHEQTEVWKDETMISSARVGDLTWKVGDPTIIRFEERLPSTGMPSVIGLKPGTTTLTATQPNGAKAVCTITVVDPHALPGDADNSGAVTLADSILVLQHCAGETVSINLSNANANGDGKVDIYDALLIMQYVAGWNVTLQ